MADGGYLVGGDFVQNNTTPPEPSTNIFSLAGRTAIISGAGGGIGLAVAEAFAGAGANVAIWYNSNARAVEEAHNIEVKYNVKCKAYQVDISTYEAIERAVNLAISDLGGRLDIFVANAGITWTQGAAIDGSVDHYKHVMNTNVDGTFYCAKAVGTIWKRQKITGKTIDGRPLTNYHGGSFIATASVSAHIVNIPQRQAVYNASKAGIVHLCKSLAVEWVSFARVNCVSPGYIATEITSFADPAMKDIWRSKTPMGREGQAHELKGIYLYLASDAASYTTGADMIVDGGYSII
ncbi:sorbose reductase SOU1 [Bisporella sp. PMI_857]|nr:sorbose reductase SOU1 [Bisporella sp. PMI_857]